MITCTRAELQYNMLHQQSLSVAAHSVEQAVTQMLGCRGAEGSTPYLSLLWRVKGFQPDQFDKAVHQDRSLLRVRGPRGTFYWVTPALAPLFLAAARELPLAEYLNRWGMQEGEYRAIREEITLAVAGRPLGLSELKKRFPSQLQRPVHRRGSPASTTFMVGLEAMQLYGEVTLLKEPGFHRHQSNTYHGDARDTTRPNLIALIADRYPTVEDPHEDIPKARQSLVRAYIQTYGPVTLEDIAWWTGWTKREVRAHIQSLSGELQETYVQGLNGSFLIHAETWNPGTMDHAGESVPVHLLPGGDSLMKAYDGFGRFLARSTDDHNVLRFMPAVLVDGLGQGDWAYRISPDKVEVVVELFEPPQESVLPQLRASARLVADFVSDGAKPVEIHVQERIGPWNPRDPFPDVRTR